MLECCHYENKHLMILRILVWLDREKLGHVGHRVPDVVVWSLSIDHLLVMCIGIY